MWVANCRHSRVLAASPGTELPDSGLNCLELPMNCRLNCRNCRLNCRSLQVAGGPAKRGACASQARTAPSRGSFGAGPCDRRGRRDRNLAAFSDAARRAAGRPQWASATVSATCTPGHLPAAGQLPRRDTLWSSHHGQQSPGRLDDLLIGTDSGRQGGCCLELCYPHRGGRDGKIGSKRA